jgi:DNA repair protein RadC
MDNELKLVEYIPQQDCTVKYKTIKDWRLDERPRERLVNHGPATLSDSELLAILIGHGTPGFSAVDVAKQLLERYGNLTNLAACDMSELRKIKGVGNVKSVTISAAFELGRRIEMQPFEMKNSIRTPEDLANYFIPRLRHERKEKFYVIMLNTANQIIRSQQVSEGILNASMVHPREVFRTAITESAAGVMLLHNHPSGNPEPSTGDIEITRQLVAAGDIIDIKVYDHLIIAGEQFTSLARIGLI